MNSSFPILSLCIWLPIIGGLWVIFAGSRVGNDAVRKDSLLISIATFIASLFLYSDFDLASTSMQFVEQHPWIEPFDIFYHVGIDGIALPLILLTTFITPLIVLAGWEVITDRVSQYMGAFLILEGLMVGVFSALDAILFYVFWEGAVHMFYYCFLIMV